MPHMIACSNTFEELVRAGAYDMISRVGNGRVYLQGVSENYYVGPGVFESAERAAVVFTFKAHQEGGSRYCILENLDDTTRADLIDEFLTAHGMSEAQLQTKTLSLPSGWTQD